MSNTRESSVPTKSTYQKSFRKAGLATTVFAGIAAMALAFGAPAQAASTVISEGHIDVARASISANGKNLALGTNDEFHENYYTAAQAGNLEFDVTKKEGNNWIIPATQAGNELFTGFAGSGNEAPGAGSGQQGLYTKLAAGDHVKFTVAPAASNPGSLSLDFPASTGVVTSGNTYTAAQGQRRRSLPRSPEVDLQRQGHLPGNRFRKQSGKQGWRVELHHLEVRH